MIREGAKKGRQLSLAVYLSIFLSAYICVRGGYIFVSREYIEGGDGCLQVVMLVYSVGHFTGDSRAWEGE